MAREPVIKALLCKGPARRHKAFLAVAAFFPSLKGVMGWMKRHMDRIEKVSGLLLWTVGLLMITGQFSALSYWLLETLPGLAALG